MYHQPISVDSPPLALSPAPPTIASPAAVWCHQLPKLLRNLHVTDETTLPTIWWKISTLKCAMRPFHIKVEVDTTSAQFRLATP